MVDIVIKQHSAALFEDVYNDLNAVDDSILLNKLFSIGLDDSVFNFFKSYSGKRFSNFHSFCLLCTVHYFQMKIAIKICISSTG